MTTFQRAFLHEGDTTTTGGRIESHPQAFPVTYGRDNKHATFEGDTVWCPACQSHGITQCVPPFLPYTGPDGRQHNLDGDLCLCNCTTPPRLIGSMTYKTMRFTSDFIARTPGCAGWLVYAGHEQHQIAGFDGHFVVVDNATNAPVSGFSYGIQSSTGEHHDQTYNDGSTAAAYASEAQDMTLLYNVQTAIHVIKIKPAP